MVRVIVHFVIDDFGIAGFPWEQKHRSEIQSCRRDEDEGEQEERPLLLVTPPIENPPCYNEISEEVYDPNHVHPIDAAIRARLEHFSNASQNTGHAQGQNDGDQNREILECVHGLRNVLMFGARRLM